MHNQRNAATRMMHSSWRTRFELWLALKFVLVFAILYGAYRAARGSSLEHLLIHDFTVRPAAFIINWLYPAEQAVAQNHRIVGALGGLNVLPGCEGTEALFLLIAALVAYPLGLRQKLMGLLYCVALVFLLNQLRLVALFFAARYDRELFSWLHGFVAPGAIIVIGALFLIGWISAQNLNDQETASA